DLIVNNVSYKNGIGVHSNSILEFEVPQGFTRFKASVGIDRAAAVQNVGATVNFMVFTKDPSGPVPPPSETIAVNLSELGIKSSCVITDLWTGRVLGQFKRQFAPEINRHGAGLYKIVVKKEQVNYK
ncbi:MAG TPA: NPCBM/NEW2 domain-containing protein, partial [Flavisolibacter sp.]|nr:NPCBM/NEW2 domain-containing protein [Flavisolibacter sp.]